MATTQKGMLMRYKGGISLAITTFLSEETMERSKAGQWFEGLINIRWKPTWGCQERKDAFRRTLHR